MEGVAEAVGEGIDTGVAVNESDVPVPVGGGNDVAVCAPNDVSVGDGNGSTVGVSESVVEVLLGDGNGSDVCVSEESDDDVPMGEDVGGAIVAVIG